MPKTATEITADAIATLLSATNQATNLNIGSNIRSILDAVGAEGALIEREIVDQVQQAMQNVAYGIWQVTPNPAVASVYQLQFTNTTSGAVTIAQGTTVTISNSSLLWTTETPVTIPAQSGGTPGTATVNAQCNVTGSQTNVPANTITVLTSPISGITVTNPSAQAVVLGADTETSSQTQARLANKISSIHRGDKYAVEWGALASFLIDSSGNITEQVVKAKAVDLPAGDSMVYVVNATNGLSANLQSQTQQIINGYTDAQGVKHSGYKAAGIAATVTLALVNALDTTIQILPLPGMVYNDLLPQVHTTIDNFFAGLDIEQSFSLGSFILSLRSTPGVGDVAVTVPSASLIGVPNVANPSAAPVLMAVAGSTGLAPGTYTVGYTYTTAWGETLFSPTATVTITAGQAIQVSALTLPFGAAGVNYYLSVAAGSATVAYDAAGTGAQINLTALPATGAVSSPLTNTALAHGNLYVEGATTISQMAG